MVTYDNSVYFSTSSTSSSISTTTNDWATGNGNYYFEVDMSKETFKAKSPAPAMKKKDKNHIESGLLTELMKDPSLSSGHSIITLHGPGSFYDSNIYMRGAKFLRSMGYNSASSLCRSFDHIKKTLSYGFGVVFLVNVLECIPSKMERALILKNIIGKFSRDVIGILIIDSRTKEDLDEEAEKLKYLAKDDGYMIKDSNIRDSVFASPVERSDILDLLHFVGVNKSHIKQSDRESGIAITIPSQMFSMPRIAKPSSSHERRRL